MSKSKRFEVRMTPEEYETISKKAQKAKLSMSEFVLMSCLGKQIFVVEGLDKLLKEHKAQGRNLNQLTKLAQSGAVSVAGLEEINTSYKEIYCLLYNMYQRRRWR